MFSVYCWAIWSDWIVIDFLKWNVILSSYHQFIATPVYFVCMDLPILDILYKWGYIRKGCLYLVLPNWYNVSEVHSWHCMRQDLIPLMASNIPLYRYITGYFSTTRWALDRFYLFTTMNNAKNVCVQVFMWTCAFDTLGYVIFKCLLIN